MKENSFYRQQGKALTKGKILNIFLITFIFASIIGVITSIGSSFAPVFDPETLQIVDPGNPGLSQLFNLIAIALSGYVLYGTTKMFIQVTQNQQPDIETTLLYGPKEQPTKAPLLNVIQGILIGLWTLLFIIPGIIKSYSYALTTLILVNEPTSQPLATITKSRQLMDGKKMQLFLLDLSYLGWYILSLFTLGILAVWVIAWHQTARTLFLLDAYQPNNR